MFREMRRFKQQISEEECIKVLKEQPRGVLSMLGDEGYPYGVPMNHYYSDEDGHLYFHGAGVGHKIDSIKKYEKVSFCVYDKGYRKEGEWALNINSVVVFGKIYIVEDEAKKLDICTKLCRKFTDDEEYLQRELKSSLNHVCCLELVPDHITGKLVNES